MIGIGIIIIVRVVATGIVAVTSEVAHGSRCGVHQAVLLDMMFVIDFAFAMAVVLTVTQFGGAGHIHTLHFFLLVLAQYL